MTLTFYTIGNSYSIYEHIFLPLLFSLLLCFLGNIIEQCILNCTFECVSDRLECKGHMQTKSWYVYRHILTQYKQTSQHGGQREGERDRERERERDSERETSVYAGYWPGWCTLTSGTRPNHVDKQTHVTNTQGRYWRRRKRMRHNRRRKRNINKWEGRGELRGKGKE